MSHIGLFCAPNNWAREIFVKYRSYSKRIQGAVGQRGDTLERPGTLNSIPQAHDGACEQGSPNLERAPRCPHALRWLAALAMPTHRRVQSPKPNLTRASTHSAALQRYPHRVASTVSILGR